MNEEDKLNILEEKIKNKIAFHQKHGTTHIDFDDGFIQAMNRVLEWIAKLKRDREDLL